MIASCLFLIIQIAGYAQGKYSVKVKVTDSETGDPVEFATVSVREIAKPDARRPNIKYSLTAKEGVAAIQNLHDGQWMLKAELLGYEADSVIFKIDGKGKDIGTMVLSQSKETIDAATVTAVGNSIVFKQDTIEYNRPICPQTMICLRICLRSFLV